MPRSNAGGGGPRRKVVRKKTPGSGVVAPGFKPVRKGGKIVPVAKRPVRKSPVFQKGLPSPRSQVPARPKRTKSAPNPLRVLPSGQTKRLRSYVPGTVEYQQAQRRSRSLYGDTYRALQKEERRQEKLIKAVTGKSRNVELRNTAQGVQRLEAPKRSKSALGVDKSSLAAANRASKSPEVRKGQENVDLSREVTKNALAQVKPKFPALLPFKKNYKPKPTIQQRAAKSQAKPPKVPKPLQAEAALPKPKVKPYAYKQQARQKAYADKKNIKTVRNRKASLEARTRASEELVKSQAIKGETRKQVKQRVARQKKYVEQANKAGGQVSLDFNPRREKLTTSKFFDEAAKPFKNVGKAFKKLADKTAGSAVKQDLGLPGKAAGAAVSAGKFLVEAKKEELGASPKSHIDITKAGGFSGPKSDLLDNAGKLIYKVPAYSAEAIAKDPGKQLPLLAKDTADMLKSIPAGVWMVAAEGPNTVWDQIKKDYARRYGPLVAGNDKAFRKRLEKEGVTAEVLDSLTALTIAGKTVGTAAQSVAKTGRLGKTAEAIAKRQTITKGIKKLHPNADVPKEGYVLLDKGKQSPSKNFFINVGNAGVDKARLGRYQRALRKRELEGKKLSSRDARAEELNQLRGVGTRIRGKRGVIKAENVQPQQRVHTVKIPESAAVYLSNQFRTPDLLDELGIPWKDPKAGLSKGQVAGAGGGDLKNLYRVFPEFKHYASLSDAIDLALGKAGFRKAGGQGFTRRVAKGNPSKKALEVKLTDKELGALEEVLSSSRGVARATERANFETYRPMRPIIEGASENSKAMRVAHEFDRDIHEMSGVWSYVAKQSRRIAAKSNDKQLSEAARSLARNVEEMLSSTDNGNTFGRVRKQFGKYDDSFLSANPVLDPITFTPDEMIVLDRVITGLQKTLGKEPDLVNNFPEFLKPTTERGKKFEAFVAENADLPIQTGEKDKRVPHLKPHHNADFLGEEYAVQRARMLEGLLQRLRYPGQTAKNIERDRPFAATIRDRRFKAAGLQRVLPDVRDQLARRGMAAPSGFSDTASQLSKTLGEIDKNRMRRGRLTEALPEGKTRNSRKIDSPWHQYEGEMGADTAASRELALTDYMGNYPYYGSVNNWLRGIEKLDPEKVVQMDETYLSHFLTGEQLRLHMNTMMDLFKRENSHFLEVPAEMPMTRISTAKGKWELSSGKDFAVTPDAPMGKLFDFSTDELKPGMTFRDRAFFSVSSGSNRASHASHNEWLSSKIYSDRGVIGDRKRDLNTVFEFIANPGDPAVWTSEARSGMSVTKEGKLLRTGKPGAENEVIFPPGTNFEFVGFRPISQDTDHIESPFHSSRRDFEKSALENQHKAVEDAGGPESAKWPGIPQFRIITDPNLPRPQGAAGRAGLLDEVPGRNKALPKVPPREGYLSRAISRGEQEADRLRTMVDDEAAAATKAMDKAQTPFGRVRGDLQGGNAVVVPMFFDTKYFGQSAALRRKIARQSGATWAAMRIEQQQWEKMFQKDLDQLSKEERDAFFYALRFGIRTPEQADTFLRNWRDSILKLREERRLSESERDKLVGDMWALYDEVPTINKILDAPEKYFTPKLGEFTDVMRMEARRVGSMDPTLRGNRLKMKMAEVGAQGRMLGLKLENYVKDIENVTTAEFQRYVRDVEVARKEQGLAQAGFFRGERRDRQPFAVRAPGGTEAVQPDARLRFQLVDYGAGNTNPEVFARGVMSNIKRRYNWNKVGDLYEQLASKQYRDMSLAEIQSAIDNGDINPDEVALWNPRRYRQELGDIEREIKKADVEAPKDKLGTRKVIEANPADGEARVHDAVRASTLANDDSGTLGQKISTMLDREGGPGRSTGEFKRSQWTVIPKAAHDEIFDAVKPSSAAARTISIAQGKISRTLLANPVWLQFQVASNAFLTGLVDGTGPVAILKAQKWWHSLPEDVKQAVAPYVGIHKWFDDQTRIGASRFTKGGPATGAMNGLVDAYRGLKTSKFWNPNINPLTLFLKADNAQNNWFRRAVLYNSVKREAFRNMGDEMGQAMRLQAQIMDGLTGLGPEEQMRKLLSRQDLLEEHAQHVNNILGDWTTYTAAERRVLGRFIMFYGFLRFSTKLTLFTMPFHHPLTTEIMLQLAKVQKDELQKIYGTDVPFWEIGNYVNPKTKTRIETARINPFFSAYNLIIGPKGTEADARNVFSFLPPYFAMVANQFTHSQNEFGGKPWSVNGNPSWLIGDQPVRPADQAQIFLASLLKLSPYYRALSQTGLPGRKPNTFLGPLRGKQTNDSSIFFPNPVKYTPRDVRGRRKVRQNQKLIQEQNQHEFSDTMENIGIPFMGTDAQRRIDSARKWNSEQAKKTKKKKARKRKSGLWTPSG